MYDILEGIKILDLTNVLAGPFCTYQLSMLGAEVIKIERPVTGDLARKLGVDEKLNALNMGTSFLAQNANKQSVVMDLKDKKATELFYKMSEDVDVIVENFKPGVVKTLGIDYEKISAINPKIIYCSISGFGQYGDLSEKPAYDQIIQGMSGIMSLNGNKDLNPLRCGFPVCDTTGGLTAAVAVLAALFMRERTGRGDYIDVSMFDSTLPILGWAVSNYLIGGKKVEPMGNDNFTAAPSGTFETKDGLINISTNEDKQWKKLCKAIERQELASDPKYITKQTRKAHRFELNSIINGELTKESTSYWVELFGELNIPCGEVLDLEKVFQLKHVKDRELIKNFTSSKIDREVKILGIGAKFKNAGIKKISPAPGLGEHSDLVLKKYCEK